MELGHYFSKMHSKIQASAGHRRFKLKGVDGVLVPEDPITFIEFNESIRAQIEEGTHSEDGQELTKDELELNM